MRIDPNCVRDLLTVVEESCTDIGYFEYQKSNKPVILQNHLHDSIIKHAYQCHDAELFKGFLINDFGTEFYVIGLTEKGLLSLRQMQDNKIWKKVLKGSFKTTAALLEFLLEHL